MIIRYNTRDGNGADIVKDVEIKEFPPETASFACPVCGKVCSSGIRVKKIVSANFTDWNYLGEYICEDCAKLFSLYFYSYEVSPRGIELFNAREAPGRRSSSGRRLYRASASAAARESVGSIPRGVSANRTRNRALE